MNKVFVTGGTGLLGARVLEQLHQTGLYEIHALKRAESDLRLLGDIANEIIWYNGDILDYDLMEICIEGSHFVFHCAAMVSFDPRDVELMMDINVEGTAQLVDICLEKNIHKLIHVSSIAALGAAAEGKTQIDEDCQWVDNGQQSNYSRSKFLSEMEVHRGIAEGLNAAIVNPSVILGVGFPDKGSTKLFKNVKKGFPYYSEGETGFVSAEDVARFMILLAESDIVDQRFILSEGNYSYKQIFDWIAEGFGVAKPHKKVGFFVRELAWRLDYIRCLFTGARPLLTKETTRSAFQKQAYDNAKSQTVGNFSYTSMAKSINEHCKALKDIL